MAGIVGVRAAEVLRIAGTEAAAAAGGPVGAGIAGIAGAARIAPAVTAAAVCNGEQVVERPCERAATAAVAGITRIAHKRPLNVRFRGNALISSYAEERREGA